VAAGDDDPWAPPNPRSYVGDQVALPFPGHLHVRANRLVPGGDEERGVGPVAQADHIDVCG
jgi:hypothetical protein